MYVQYYSSVVVEITLYGYLCYYHILSTNLTHTVARTFCHLVAIRIRINKMAEGDDCDCLNETLEQTVKPWSTSLGVFLETK